ncbi:MAG: hypothetical protein ACXVXP_04930 [Mycobacteriaceae bacterium]
MKRMILITGSAALAVFVLAGCGPSDSAAPLVPADSGMTSTAASSAALPSSSSAGSTVAPTTDQATTTVPPGSGGTPTSAAEAAAPAPNAQTAAYAAKLCTSLTPLYTFKQQNENPNLAGVTNGAQAKDLAVRVLTEGLAVARGTVSSLTALGPPPDAQAVAGVNNLVASLNRGVTAGQGILAQAQATDPNNPMALFALSSQAKSEAGTSSTSAVGALKTGTGPAMAAALHSAPQCTPLGL